MSRVRHCRVTSLASGMLRMILPGPPTDAAFASAGVTWRGLGWFEGPTVCDRPRPVNADKPSLIWEARIGLIIPYRGIYLTPPTPRYSVLGHARGLSEDAT